MTKYYKGFNKDMTCRGFQYEEGKTYETDEAKLREIGFHAYEMPLDCFSHYAPADSVYREVELDGVSDERENDTKVCAKKIKVGAKLDIAGIVKASIDYIFAKTEKNGEKVIADSSNSANIGSSGYSASIGSSGDSARIGSSGDYARIGSSGNYANIGSSGYSANIGSSGYSASIGSSGYYASIGSSGDSARIGSSGYSARIGSSGYSARIEVKGKNSVAMCAGARGAIKAALGCWITLAEWNFRGEPKPVCVRSAQIDGEKLKPDTWYTLKNGEFVEVEDE